MSGNLISIAVSAKMAALIRRFGCSYFFHSQSENAQRHSFFFSLEIQHKLDVLINFPTLFALFQGFKSSQTFEMHFSITRNISIVKEKTEKKQVKGGE
mmetsp:Transcript_18563/g.24000  ORF Transcript_18563/g.24000 Transcript_18563/m.24000 type:complete len:98 (-) Transcript_18563:109-402(-)